MSEPWLAHYDQGVPQSIGTYPEDTLAAIFSRHARTKPNDIAISFKGRQLTYAEIEREAAALAAGLAKLGIRERDRVALVLPNCPQFVIATLAVWRLGAIVHALNPIYTEREMHEAVRDMQPAMVITLTPFYKKIKECEGCTFIRRVIATNIKEYLPPLLRVLFTLVKEKKEGHRITLENGDLWFQDLVREGQEDPIVQIAARHDDPAAILMSGGTTGTPKGVLIQHRNLIMCGTQIAEWLREPLAVEGAAILLPLPLFHIYGLGVLGSCTVGKTRLILIPNPRDVGDLLATIKRERPSILCGVPTLFTAILNRPEVAAGKVDFSSIKACFSGAAALMAETKKRFETITGARIVEGYSLTEAVMACCVNPFRGANKIGSVGMPLPDVKIRILNSDDGLREMPAGETGEIVISAPQLMQGYWNNPDESANVLRIMADGSIGLYTGDLGYLDEDGYLFLVDRKKDLIKTSGLQVWPREVEEVLATHAAVQEVGVAGLPDERRGEIVAAWIVPRSGVAITAEELRNFCREKLAPYKIPSRIEFRGELPKTLVGKVLRRALVAEVTAEMAARRAAATSS
ncbi:MAG TPA: AMP-binding protein [Thermoanaerobaculia bacterium]|nr:AMP-binding protein [Thermoanaerobaculia bacterium]